MLVILHKLQENLDFHIHNPKIPDHRAFHHRLQGFQSLPNLEIKKTKIKSYIIQKINLKLIVESNRTFLSQKKYFQKTLQACV